MKNNFDSDMELWFSWWLNELVEAGYVIDYTDAKTYLLSEKLDYQYLDKKKTKSILKEQSLIQQHVYTPDFDIRWHKSALGIFINPPITALELNDNSVVCRNTQLNKLDKDLFIKSGDAMLVETKGGYSKFGGLKENSINRKWLFARYRIFVNLVKVPDIFAKTFTPKKFLLTSTGKQRTIHFKIKILEEYINERNP